MLDLLDGVLFKSFFPFKLGFEWGGGGSKKKTETPPPYQSPPYVPSSYDDASSKDIFNFYDPKVRGENLGYASDDLKIMENQAQDYSTRNMNEAIRRGGAARRPGTGGTRTGGMDTMRDEAIRTGLEYRSNAMRDIAVRNAVQKHSDQWNATTGLGNFLNNERSHAISKWSGNTQGAQTAYQYNQLYPMLLSNEENLYGRASDNQMIGDAGQLLLNLFSRKPTVNAGY